MLNLSKRKNTIRLGIGLIIFISLLLIFEPKEIGRLLLNVNYIYVLISFFICFIVLIIRTYRWKLILYEIKIESSFWKLVEIYLIGTFFNTFLPSSIGGDIYRIYDIYKISSKKIRPVLTVVIERITGVIALISICVISLIYYSHISDGSQKSLLIAVAGLLIVTILSIFSIYYFEKIYFIVRQKFSFKFLQIIPDEKIIKITSVITEIKKNKKLLLKAYLLGIILQLFMILAYYTTSLALNHKIPISLFFIIIPIIEIVGLIPISINGLGVKEGSLVYFFKTIGVSPAFSMSLSILFRLISIALALIGGGLLIFKRMSSLNEKN